MAATTEFYVELTLGYSNTEKTRTYKFSGLSESIADSLTANINSYNATLPAGDGNIFISDDYDDSDPQNVIGKLTGIVGARSVTVTEEEIPIL